MFLGHYENGVFHMHFLLRLLNRASKRDIYAKRENYANKKNALTMHVQNTIKMLQTALVFYMHFKILQRTLREGDLKCQK